MNLISPRPKMAALTDPDTTPGVLIRQRNRQIGLTRITDLVEKQVCLNRAAMQAMLRTALAAVVQTRRC